MPHPYNEASPAVYLPYFMWKRYTLAGVCASIVMAQVGASTVQATSLLPVSVRSNLVSTEILGTTKEISSSDKIVKPEATPVLLAAPVLFPSVASNTARMTPPSLPNAQRINKIPTPTPSPQKGAFVGQYYDNMTLSGLPVVERNDQDINFDWAEGKPDHALPADGFSVRWTKKQQLKAATYRFTTTSDDGVRLIIDGIPYIDKWVDQRATEFTVDVGLDDGEHQIVMEYYERTGNAKVTLSWQSVGEKPTTDMQGIYFTNSTLASPAVLTRKDDAIAFDWGYGSPAPEIPVDNFSVRWKKTESFAGGEYRFTTTSDDGVRIFIDNILVLNAWKDQHPTTYTSFATIDAGIHTVVVEYYERHGTAQVKANWTRVSGPPSKTFTAEYFTNETLSGTPRMKRNDSDIQFNWEHDSPSELIPDNHFSVRWLKTHTFENGKYTFTATADDGIRIAVDEVVVLDKWVNQPAKTYTVDVPLSAGDHTVKVEYYDHEGSAIADVTWKKQ